MGSVMGGGGGDRRNRRGDDRARAWLKVQVCVMLGIFPIAAMVLEICTDWTLTGNWVTLYIGGVVAATGLAFGLVRRNGNTKP